MSKRASITAPPRNSIYLGRLNPKSVDLNQKNSSRKSQTNILPIKIFMSKGKYYNYALERISYPNSKYYLASDSIQDSPSLRVRKRDSIMKEPLILSYQKVNMISYRIAHTAFVDGESLNSDHICKIDHENMRCNICGCHMGWMFVTDGMKYLEPTRIDYFDYETIFFEENQKNENDSLISFKNIRNIKVLRKFFSYIVERNSGVGFRELYEKFKLINLYPANVFRELGIPYRELVEKSNEHFRIEGDFEGANIQAYHYKIEESTCKIRLLIRGDSNILELKALFWFYFKITVRSYLKIEFEILNFKEKPGLFDQDGLVYIYDERVIDQNENYSPGKSRWRPHKDHVFFSKNEYRNTIYRSNSIDQDINNNDNEKKETVDKKNFYSLKFNYEFDKATKNLSEEVLFAAYVPYTYNDLLNFLGKQEKRMYAKAMQEQEFDHKTKRIYLRNDLIHYERLIVSHTKCGTPIFLIKITSSLTADEIDKNDYFPITSKKKKKSIVIFARQLPFEVASSWIIEGIIINLLNDNKKMNLFRTFFNFYIIPMVNVDGVMLGNTNSGLSGVKFNSIWNNPNIDIHPEIYHIKEYFSKIQNEILLFFDFHSTYHKSGVFLFSNGPKINVNNALLTEENVEKYLSELGTIMLLAKLFKSHTKVFNEKECKYRVNKRNKKNSAGYVFHNEFNIKYCYSLQSSLYNYIDTNDNNIKDFKLEDYRNFGKDFLSCIFDFVMILAENWMENDKKSTENVDKKNNMKFSSPLNKTRKDKPKSEEKISNQQEKEKYFFHHLQKIIAEFEIKKDWKNYFNSKELRYLKHKSKIKLIPIETLEAFEKSKKKKKKKIASPSSSPVEKNLDFLQNLISLNQKKEENAEILSNPNSIDLLEDLSFESFEKDKEKTEILEIKTQQKNTITFYKGSNKNDSFNEKSSKSPLKNGNSILDKNANIQLKKKIEENISDNFYPVQDYISNSFHILTSKKKEIKEINLNNSSILIGNTTNYTLNQNLKKEYPEENPSSDKSISFNKNSTFRIDPLNQPTLYKRKSSLNLEIFSKKEDSENLKNEILSSQPLFLHKFNENLPQPNISESLLFNKSELRGKLIEKLRSKTAMSDTLLKNSRFPIRKKKIMEEKGIEDLKESDQIISNKRYKWRLMRPCSLGGIPVNPFIKHKKEIQRLYSFHLNSNYREENKKGKTKNNNEENKKENKNLFENEKNKTGESLPIRIESKRASFSPWSEKKTQS